jgi:hypothetical protein
MDVWSFIWLERPLEQALVLVAANIAEAARVGSLLMAFSGKRPL